MHIHVDKMCIKVYTPDQLEWGKKRTYGGKEKKIMTYSRVLLQMLNMSHPERLWSYRSCYLFPNTTNRYLYWAMRSFCSTNKSITAPAFRNRQGLLYKLLFLRWKWNR